VSAAPSFTQPARGIVSYCRAWGWLPVSQPGGRPSLFLGGNTRTPGQIPSFNLPVLVGTDPAARFIRRQETQERVIGTLLGSVGADGVVDVRNSYAVPHNEQNGQAGGLLRLRTSILPTSISSFSPRLWKHSTIQPEGKSCPDLGSSGCSQWPWHVVYVDVEFHRAMIELHQKVNPKELIVGWYSTGDGVVPMDALIHEVRPRTLPHTGGARTPRLIRRVASCKLPFVERPLPLYDVVRA